MPIPVDYEDIIQSLTTNTEAGHLNWTSNVFGYKAEIANSQFSTWAGNDEETDVPFVAFALNDLSGNTLDTWFIEPYDDDYERMRIFHALAKRHALQIPDRLAKIKTALKEMEVSTKK